MNNSPVRKQPYVRVLLEAELRGRHLIDEARNRRRALLRTVPKAAQEDIAPFQESKRVAYEKILSDVQSDASAKLTEIQRQTQNAIADMNKRVDAVKDTVVELLVDLVCNVKPEIHYNVIERRRLEEATEPQPLCKRHSMMSEEDSFRVLNCISTCEGMFCQANNSTTESDV